jgi:predicted DNA binding CopG/RHH family protein
MTRKIKLDKEELELLESVDKGEWRSINPTPALLRKLQKSARAGLSKDRRINIRLPSRVLEGIQLRAIEEGIPYQTLISSILFKFASGRLVDTVKKSLPMRSQKRNRQH